MDYRTIQVTPCSPVIGAEIRGVDLTQPLSDDQWNEVLDAFHEYAVIFFRDQRPMTPEQHVALASASARCISTLPRRIWRVIPRSS